MGEHLQLITTATGHGDWVTQLATTPDHPDVLLSSSRDKSMIIWRYDQNADGDKLIAMKRLRGHGSFVSDCVISSDGQFALSSSWDKTIRLWDLEYGETTRQFKGHTKDVLSVAFSADNRQIVSGSRDKTIKLWNTLGVCKYTIQDDSHDHWVSCVRFSPSTNNPVILSCGFDKVVKVWNLSNCKLKTNHMGHTGYLNTVTVSPDGSLSASGGQDGKLKLWDLSDGKHLYTLSANGCINSLVFSPNRYWLLEAANTTLKIWDLESKSVVDTIEPEVVSGKPPKAVSLAWSNDGQILFSGWTDNKIRVYQVAQAV